MKKIIKKDWIWMPHAGHWILGIYCRFVLNTYVGGYVVSTLGECPKQGGRDTDEWHRVGAGDESYETMVFKAQRSGQKCCPWEIRVEKEQGQWRYMTAAEATKGHYALCKKFAQKKSK